MPSNAESNAYDNDQNALHNTALINPFEGLLFEVHTIHLSYLFNYIDAI